MRELGITYEEVYDLLHHACTTISPDVLHLMKNAARDETHEEARVFLETMIENVAQATKLDKPVCQSPGYPTVWISFGQAFNMDPLLSYLPRALTEATKAGLIRPSIVHPLTRHNPGDSTGKGVPNVELRHVPGQEYVEIILSAKGCGAELGNVSKILTPATLGKNYEGLKRLVLDTVINAGGFPARRPLSALALADKWTLAPNSAARPSVPETGWITTPIRCWTSWKPSC